MNDSIDTFLMATFLRMYLFSVTNPREVEAGAQPHLEQVGPFTYSEQVERVNEVGCLIQCSCDISCDLLTRCSTVRAAV